MQTPTVGRALHFFAAGSDRAQAATVAGVNSDGTVNLGLLSPDGHSYAAKNVPLMDDDEKSEAEHARWPVIQQANQSKPTKPKP